jgi:hypothetical protein
MEDIFKIEKEKIYVDNNDNFPPYKKLNEIYIDRIIMYIL